MQVVQRLYDMISVSDDHVGIVFVQGAGMRVGIVRGGAFDHMSPQAAWKMARAEDEGSQLAAALGVTAGKVRAMGLASQDAEGRA
jgi:hypothetical protein